MIFYFAKPNDPMQMLSLYTPGFIFGDLMVIWVLVEDKISASTLPMATLDIGFGKLLPSIVIVSLPKFKRKKN